MCTGHGRQLCGYIFFDVQHGRYFKLVYLILDVRVVRSVGLEWKLEHVSFVQ